MNNKVLSGLLAVLFFVGIGSQALAMGERGERGSSIEKRIDRIAKDLGLTQVQRDKYLEGAKKIDEESKALNAKNRELFASIKKELLKDSPDSKIIADHIQKIGQNRTKIQIERMNQMIELRKELTPEQKSKLEKLMSEKKENRIKKLKEFRKFGKDN